MSGWDRFANAVGGFAKLVVGLIWGAGAVVMFGSGQILVGLVAVLYLVYLFVFGGRWLLY